MIDIFFVWAIFSFFCTIAAVIGGIGKEMGIAPVVVGTTTGAMWTAFFVVLSY